VYQIFRYGVLYIQPICCRTSDNKASTSSIHSRDDACYDVSIQRNMGPIPRKPGPASASRRRVPRPPRRFSTCLPVRHSPPRATTRPAAVVVVLAFALHAHHTGAPAKDSTSRGSSTHNAKLGSFVGAEMSLFSTHKPRTLDLRWNVGLTESHCCMHVEDTDDRQEIYKAPDIYYAFISTIPTIYMSRIMTGELALTRKLRICEPTVGQHKSYISSCKSAALKCGRS
jgi:hypothetical protein